MSFPLTQSLRQICKEGSFSGVSSFSYLFFVSPLPSPINFLQLGPPLPPLENIICLTTNPLSKSLKESKPETVLPQPHGRVSEGSKRPRPPSLRLQGLLGVWEDKDGVLGNMVQPAWHHCPEPRGKTPAWGNLVPQTKQQSVDTTSL